MSIIVWEKDGGVGLNSANKGGQKSTQRPENPRNYTQCQSAAGNSYIRQYIYRIYIYLPQDDYMLAGMWIVICRLHFLLIAVQSPLSIYLHTVYLQNINNQIPSLMDLTWKLQGSEIHKFFTPRSSLWFSFPKS